MKNLGCTKLVISSQSCWVLFVKIIFEFKAQSRIFWTLSPYPHSPPSRTNIVMMPGRNAKRQGAALAKAAEEGITQHTIPPLHTTPCRPTHNSAHYRHTPNNSHLSCQSSSPLPPAKLLQQAEGKSPAKGKGPPLPILHSHVQPRTLPYRTHSLSTSLTTVPTPSPCPCLLHILSECAARH